MDNKLNEINKMWKKAEKGNYKIFKAEDYLKN
jgi:hypothetical protein